MLKNLFKKEFTNQMFIEELLHKKPMIKWLDEALASGSVDINFLDEKNNTPLMLTLQQSCFPSAIWLIENGADTTIKNNEKKAPIDIAIQKDKIKIVEELIKLKKINIDQKDDYGRSLLQNMVVSGNHDMAKSLIKHGANINTLDTKGKHILYDALSYGDPVFFRYLLANKNIELNHIDEDGNTLMQHPQIEQNDILAKDLLAAGADPTILNAKGESYLYKTALRGEEANEIIDLALSNGANVNAMTTTNNTIMMEIFLRASENKALYREQLLNIVTKMLEYKGDINALDSKGETGLFNAVHLRDTQLIIFLLQANIDVNIQNPQGETVLEFLVYDGLKYIKIIKLLLNYGIDPTLKNKKGQTVYEVLTNIILHKSGTVPLEDEKLIALYDPDALYFNVVQLLLDNEKVDEENGEEFIFSNLLDSHGNPLFFKPLMYDNFALFSLYTKHPINIHQENKQHHNLFFAYVLKTFENNIATASVCKNFQNNVSSLISRKLNKDFKDSLGWTILHKVLATECNLKLFKILTEVVRFDYSMTDNLGRTVIHNAVWNDNTEVIKIINKLAHQTINKEDIYGITPIYYAALLGNKILVSQFFDLGAAITLQRKIDAKAIKKFKPMLKNLEKLLVDVQDRSLLNRMESLKEQIETKFN
jgi:ankyrin repeat protein